MGEFAEQLRRSDLMSVSSSAKSAMASGIVMLAAEAVADEAERHAEAAPGLQRSRLRTALADLAGLECVCATAGELGEREVAPEQQNLDLSTAKLRYSIDASNASNAAFSMFEYTRQRLPKEAN